MSDLILITQLIGLQLSLEDLLTPASRLQLGRGPESDLDAINAELERLRQGRKYFMDWVAEFRNQDPADRRGLSPWAFLTAWNDSTARIIYLLRERRGLAGHKETEFDPIMEAVFDQIEKHAGVKALDAVADASRTSSADQSSTIVVERAGDQ